MAGECIFAVAALGGDPNEWDDVIVDAANLQQSALKRVSERFDKKPADFENRKEFNKAKRAFTAEREKALSEYFHNEAEAIVKKMNALLPKKK